MLVDTSAGMWIEKARLPCWPVYSQQVSHQRWISGIHCTQATKNASEGSTLALKPRGDVTRSPKQGYQWPHEKDLCPPKNKKKTFVFFSPASFEINVQTFYSFTPLPRGGVNRHSHVFKSCSHDFVNWCLLFSPCCICTLNTFFSQNNTNPQITRRLTAWKPRLQNVFCENDINELCKEETMHFHQLSGRFISIVLSTTYEVLGKVMLSLVCAILPTEGRGGLVYLGQRTVHPLPQSMTCWAPLPQITTLLTFPSSTRP